MLAACALLLLFLGLCGSSGAVAPTLHDSTLFNTNGLGGQAFDADILADLITAFQKASWIWTSEGSLTNAPVGDCAFRRTFATPSGKTATSALILITVDNTFSLYVNGQLVAGFTDVDWTISRKFVVPLSASSNTLAVNATNTIISGPNNPAGLLAAIQLTFSDGTTETFPSDSTWRANKVIPTNFQFPSLDDSQWDPATVLGSYGSGLWGMRVLMPTLLGSSTWIWSSETSPPNAPAKPRAFRKIFSTPSGKTLKSAQIFLTVDDGFVLYVNGALIGSSKGANAWKTPQFFAVDLSGPSTLFAIMANNSPIFNGGDNPAGLLAAIKIFYTDGSDEGLVSDATWKVNKAVPSDFPLPTIDDSGWPTAVVLGVNGVLPWGPISYPDLPLTSLDSAASQAPTAPTIFGPSRPTRIPGSPITSQGATASPSSMPPPQKSAGPAGVIAGSVLGGLAIIVLALVALWLYRRNQRRIDMRSTLDPHDMENYQLSMRVPNRSSLPERLPERLPDVHQSWLWLGYYTWMDQSSEKNRNPLGDR